MNYDELKTNLTTIIDNSENIDKCQKTILKTLFSNLAEYDKNRLDELKKEVSSKIQEKEYSKEKPGIIITALVNKKVNYNNFTNIIDFKNDFIGAFFNCSYEEYLKITDNNPYDKNYEIEIEIKNENSIIPAFCRLKTDSSYVDIEKYLYSVYEQYNIDTPMIFSPYARKFAKIVIDDESINLTKIKRIIFKNEDLNKKLKGTTLDSTLIWNVNILEKNVPCLDENLSENEINKIKYNIEAYESNSYFIPNKTNTQIIDVYKCLKNQFILFHGLGNKRIGIGRNRDESRLFVLRDGSIKIEPYAKLSVKDIDEEKLKNPDFYRNFYNQALFNMPRIRSKADIFYVINAFNDNPYGISIEENVDISTNKILPQSEDVGGGVTKVTEGVFENRIYDYEDCHRYYNTSEDKSIKLKNSTTCCLAFRGKDKVLAEDYARYVLAFLNKKYPEFYWIGRYVEK